MQRMLIGIDLRPGCAEFIGRALALARALKLDVVLVHVDTAFTRLLQRLDREEGRGMEEMQGVRRAVLEANVEAMARVLREAGEDPSRLDLRVDLGVPWQRLIEASEGAGAPLLAMGTHRAARAPVVPLGRETREAARRAPFPLVAWSSNALARTRGLGPSPRIGVGVGGMAQLERGGVLDCAVRMARRLGGSLHLLLCDELPERAGEGTPGVTATWVATEVARSRARARAELEEIAASPLLLGIDSRTQLSTGEPDEALLHAAAEGDWDLVVLGTGRRREGRGLGAIAEAVLEAAPCPVVLVPPQMGWPGAARDGGQEGPPP